MMYLFQLISYTKFSTGDKWTKRRRLITPSFHFDILNDFLFVMNEQTDVLVKLLNSPAESGKGFNICPFISNNALDIICGKYPMDTLIIEYH